MQLKVVSKKDNVLLGRTEYVIEVRANSTPSRKELLTRLAAELGADKDLIIIRKIETRTGTPDVIVYVRVYKDRAQLEAIEPKYIIERNKVVEENAENEGEAQPQA